MTFLDAIDPKSGGGLGAALKSNLAQSQKYVQESDEAMKAATKRAEEKSAKIDVEESKLDSNVLKPPKLDAFVAPPKTNPLEAFGSAAGVLAALGGLLTRQPLTTSLNAASKVLEAYQKKDAIAAQTAFDEWKVNTDNAVKLAHFELDAYRAALSKIDTDRAGTYAEMKNLTAVFQNHTANSILVTEGLDGIVKYESDMRKFAQGIPDQQLKLLELHSKQQAIAALDKEEKDRLNTPNPMTPEERVNKMNRILSGTPVTESAAATGKWEIITDPEHTDETGNTVPAKQYLMNDKTRETRDLAGNPYVASGAVKVGKEDAPGVGARKDREQTRKEEKDAATERYQTGRLTNEERRIVNTKEYQDAFMADKARGRSDTEAHWAAMDQARERDLDRKDKDSAVRQRVAEGTLSLKEKLATDTKEYKDAYLDHLRRGDSDREAQAAALIEWRNRQEDRKDLEDKLKNEGAKLTPSERDSSAAQVATGQPLTQVVPGWGQAAVAGRREVRAAAIDLLKRESPGMTDEQAGTELARRNVSYQAGTRSTVQLTTMLGATRQAVSQLEFNVDRVKEEMAKLPSTNLSPILNAIIRGEEKWTGDPAYSSLFFYMNAAAMESARLLSGGQASIAQLHEGARAEAEKWANINMTPAMFDSVAAAMKAEGHERLRDFQLAINAQIPGGGGPVAAPAAAPVAKPTAIDASGNMVEWNGTTWVAVPR